MVVNLTGASAWNKILEIMSTWGKEDIAVLKKALPVGSKINVSSTGIILTDSHGETLWKSVVLNTQTCKNFASFVLAPKVEPKHEDEVVAALDAEANKGGPLQDIPMLPGQLTTAELAEQLGAAPIEHTDSFKSALSKLDELHVGHEVVLYANDCMPKGTEIAWHELDGMVVTLTNASGLVESTELKFGPEFASKFTDFIQEVGKTPWDVWLMKYLSELKISIGVPALNESSETLPLKSKKKPAPWSKAPLAQPSKIKASLAELTEEWVANYVMSPLAAKFVLENMPDNLEISVNGLSGEEAQVYFGSANYYPSMSAFEEGVIGFVEYKTDKKFLNLVANEAKTPAAAGPAMAALTGGSASVGPVSEYPVYDESAMVNLTPLQLAEAKGLYCPVKGTDSHSRYFLVADYGQLKVGARIKGNSLSLRLEGPWVKSHGGLLGKLGLGTNSKDGKEWYSCHLNLGNGLPHWLDSKRALAAVCAGIDLPKLSPEPDLKLIIGKGI